MTDRDKLEKVAADYRELALLRIEQHKTMAQLIRVCIAQLRSPNATKRTEAVAALGDLANMLEGKNNA